MVYQSYTKGAYIYPGWANGIGWLIAASSMVLIPGWAIYYIIKTPGSLKQVSQMTKGMLNNFIDTFS